MGKELQQNGIIIEAKFIIFPQDCFFMIPTLINTNKPSYQPS